MGNHGLAVDLGGGAVPGVFADYAAELDTEPLPDGVRVLDPLELGIMSQQRNASEQCRGSDNPVCRIPREPVPKLPGTLRDVICDRLYHILWEP
jgi:hypothetical protein